MFDLPAMPYIRSEANLTIYFQTDDYSNPLRYAWQAGVHFFSFFRKNNLALKVYPPPLQRLHLFLTFQPLWLIGKYG